MIIVTIMARVLDTSIIKEEEEESGHVFALICDNVGSGDQSKKHRVIYDKIMNTKVEITEEV